MLRQLHLMNVILGSFFSIANFGLSAFFFYQRRYVSAALVAGLALMVYVATRHYVERTDIQFTRKVMKIHNWLAAACVIGAGIYFFKSRPAPPAEKTIPTALINSIRYLKKKDGTEVRFVTLMGEAPCVQGELSNGASVEVLQSYDYRRAGRNLTLLDGQGSVVGTVQINYEGLACPGDSDSKDTESGQDSSSNQ